MSLLTIFVTGLFAGGITCLAVQGGLLATSLSWQKKEAAEKELSASSQLLPILSFLSARLLAYTALGLLLGLLGSAVQLSLNAKVILQFIVVFFMIGTALNLLEVHPLFRYFVIQPPKVLARLVRNQSKSKSIFGPALLGAFTVLIPCGATQAMMAYAMTTGSASSGAISMFVFILGTSPLFFLLGFAAKKISQLIIFRNINFNKIAAVAIIIIALFSLNGALNLAGSTLNFGKFFSNKQQVKGATSTVDQATIYFTRSGYVTDPARISVKGGSTLKLKLVNQDGAGCVQAFTIPKFGIQRTVPLGSTGEIILSIPNISGEITFMCSMGMYKGVINVD